MGSIFKDKQKRQTMATSAFTKKVRKSIQKVSPHEDNQFKESQKFLYDTYSSDTINQMQTSFVNILMKHITDTVKLGYAQHLNIILLESDEKFGTKDKAVYYNNHCLRIGFGVEPCFLDESLHDRIDVYFQMVNELNTKTSYIKTFLNDVIMSLAYVDDIVEAMPLPIKDAARKHAYEIGFPVLVLRQPLSNIQEHFGSIHNKAIKYIGFLTMLSIVS